MGMKKKLIYILKIIKNSAETSPIVSHCRDWTANTYLRYFLIIVVTPFCLLKYLYIKNFPERKGLAFVLIAKNEAPYSEEWVNFHHKQGVSHFIIYDNESEDNLHEVLKPYINAGLVTYHFMPRRARQIDAYNIAVHDYGHKFKYMGFIDADEFVFVRNNTYEGKKHDLYAFVDGFMKAHPNAGGIGINWCVFGSNGHITKPEGGVLENYTMRSKDNHSDNRHIKTICDPLKIFAFRTMHFLIFRRGFKLLDENGEILNDSLSKEVHSSKIRINHYCVKSFEEFKAKRMRGLADRVKGITSMQYFDHHDQNVIHDTEIISLM